LPDESEPQPQVTNASANANFPIVAIVTAHARRSIGLAGAIHAGRV
jgi:hypothetical protein